MSTELDFYNVNNIPIISIGDEAEIFMKKIEFPDKQLFYAARKKGRASALASQGISNQLICQGLPEWILKFNINKKVVIFKRFEFSNFMFLSNLNLLSKK